MPDPFDGRIGKTRDQFILLRKSTTDQRISNGTRLIVISYCLRWQYCFRKYCIIYTEVSKTGFFASEQLFCQRILLRNPATAGRSRIAEGILQSREDRRIGTKGIGFPTFDNRLPFLGPKICVGLPAG